MHVTKKRERCGGAFHPFRHDQTIQPHYFRQNFQDQLCDPSRLHHISVSPSISSSIERTYHRWVSTMVNWTLTYIWSVVRSQENDSDFSRISRSAVRYSSAHMDSPIIFEKVDQGKKSGTYSPVCTTIYPVLFVKIYFLAVHIHQVVLLPSSIPSDLSPFSWGHSFHSRIKLVGCMQSSHVYTSLVVYLHGLPDIWS